MRLLMIMLTCLWLCFGMLCYKAMRWQEPYEVPWHAVQALQSLTPELIDVTITEAYIAISHIENGEGESFSTSLLADYYLKLAEALWLKAYVQTSRILQTAYLEHSLSELSHGLRKLRANSEPGTQRQREITFLYSIADIHHQLKNYTESQACYLKVFQLKPENPKIRKRYEDMLKESGLIDPKRKSTP